MQNAPKLAQPQQGYDTEDWKIIQAETNYRQSKVPAAPECRANSWKMKQSAALKNFKR